MGIPVIRDQGLGGTATVRALNNKIIVKMDDGRQFDIFKEDAPEYYEILARITTENNNRAESMSVKLNSEGTRLFGVYPPGNRSYVCVFSGFRKGRDEQVPTPRRVEGRSVTSRAGKQIYFEEHLAFYPIFTIQSGKFRGLTLSYELWYAFGLAAEGGGTLTAIRGKGQGNVIDFLQRCGMDFATDEIPWSDNVLPYIERILKERSVPVTVEVNEKGYFHALASLPDGMEAVAPKKSTKKAK